MFQVVEMILDSLFCFDTIYLSMFTLCFNRMFECFDDNHLRYAIDMLK